MALFSKKVAVNVDDVACFRDSVNGFSQSAYNSGESLVKNLNEMAAEAASRAKELKQVAESYDRLYSSIKQLERSILQNIRSIKQELSNTPKVIEEEYTDKDGTVKVKKKPNPRYSELEFEIRREEHRLAQLRELSWKVYNEVSYSHRVAGELEYSAGVLKNLIPEMQSNVRAIVSKSEIAENSLESTIRAINNYMSFNFRA